MIPLPLPKVKLTIQTVLRVKLMKSYSIIPFTGFYRSKWVWLVLDSTWTRLVHIRWQVERLIANHQHQLIESNWARVGYQLVQLNLVKRCGGGESLELVGSYGSS